MKLLTIGGLHDMVTIFTILGDETGSITYTDELLIKTTFYEIIIPD